MTPSNDGITTSRLEGAGTPIPIVTNHCNLQYFSTTKVLSHWQARCSEYLSQFNMVIRFHPRKLGTKPDVLTHCWDVYPKEGSSNYSEQQNRSHV